MEKGEIDNHEADCIFAIPHILELTAQLCKSCKHDCAVNSILSFNVCKQLCYVYFKYMALICYLFEECTLLCITLG